MLKLQETVLNKTSSETTGKRRMSTTKQEHVDGSAAQTLL